MSLLALPILGAHPLSGSNLSEILPCLVKARAIIFLMQHFNSSYFFYLEAHNLPGQPALEVALAQTKACLRTMPKYDLAACALVQVEDFFC